MKTYEYIMSDIQAKIEKGVYKPDDQLPSLRELAKLYHTTPVTAKKSLAILEERGYIYVLDRKGFFISAPRHKNYSMIFHELKSINESTSLEIESIGEISGKELNLLFGTNVPSDVKCVRLVRSILNKTIPVGLDIKYLVYNSKAKPSLRNVHRLQATMSMVLENYDIQKQLEICVLEDNGILRERCYLDEADAVFYFLQTYRTDSGQVAGISQTYVPCEEITLKMSY